MLGVGAAIYLVQYRAWAVLCMTALLVTPVQAGSTTDPLHAWVAGDDPGALEAWVNTRLMAAQRQLHHVLAVKGARTVANTLRPYDDMQNELNIAGNQASLMYAVATSAQLRDKGQALSQKIAGVFSDLSLNQAIYKALRAVPLPTQDAPTRYYLQRTLFEYRLAGVDKDATTRARIHIVQDRIVGLSLAFGRNVQDGIQKVSATRAELDGLPEDYIRRHQPDSDGQYTITTDEPDASPVLDFAKNAALRRRVFLAYNMRAYPENKQILLDMLSARHDLALLLGYPSYADFATADQMMGNEAHVHQLLEEVDAVSRPAQKREYEQLLAFAQASEPSTTGILQSDGPYWMEKYRRARYAFDAQSVRPYFAYDKVEAGILDAAAKLFHVQFMVVNNAVVWHPSVTTFDVLDRGHRVGRIYLDMHPRQGKDKWFSSAPVVPGIRGRQLPEGVLICNFSGGVKSDPGLMQYKEVVTFFHEFGHLMHHVLGSQNRWSGQGGFNVEGDFVEAPSQMLEEFFRSPGVLAPFAKHYQSGAVIPAALVGRMNAADAFGRGTWMQGQLFYSAYSLQLHERAPAQIDLDAQLRQNAEQFSPYTFVDGNRMYASFTHLTEYASNYYTYVLDKVIALDFYAQFDQSHPLEGSAAARYRRDVIDPGATKPGAELIMHFLGRAQNMNAFKAWVNAQFEPANAQREPFLGPRP